MKPKRPKANIRNFKGYVDLAVQRKVMEARSGMRHGSSSWKADKRMISEAMRVYGGDMEWDSLSRPAKGRLVNWIGSVLPMLLDPELESSPPPPKPRSDRRDRLDLAGFRNFYEDVVRRHM